MPIFNFNPGSGVYAWDSWGWQPRNDWAPVPGRTGLWHISGESPNDGEAYMTSLDGFQHWGSAAEARAAMGAAPAPNPSAGVNMSETAYNNSLLAQGIDPSELPMATSGQEATARVLQEHGIALPQYLQDWLQKTGGQAAGGGNSAVLPAFAAPGMASQVAQSVMGQGVMQPYGSVDATGAPNVMQNNLQNDFLRRLMSDQINKQASVTREMIRKVMLGGQPAKPMGPSASPSLLRSAWRPMGAS